MLWSHIACGVFAAAVRRPLSPKPYGGLTALMQTVRPPHGFERAARSSQALHFFLTWHKTFSETRMSQRRNHTARPPYGGPTVAFAMAVRWHTVFTLSWVPRKSNGGLTAVLQRSHGTLTAAIRQTCGSCKNMRLPNGRRTVASRYPYGFWSHE